MQSLTELGNIVFAAWPVIHVFQRSPSVTQGIWQQAPTWFYRNPVSLRHPTSHIRQDSLTSHTTSLLKSKQTQRNRIPSIISHSYLPNNFIASLCCDSLIIFLIIPPIMTPNISTHILQTQCKASHQLSKVISQSEFRFAITRFGKAKDKDNKRRDAKCSDFFSPPSITHPHAEPHQRTRQTTGTGEKMSEVKIPHNPLCVKPSNPSSVCFLC